MSRRRVFVSLVLALGVMAAMGYAGFALNRPPPAPAASPAPATVTVARGDVQQTVTAPGVLLNAREVLLGSDVSARIADIAVRPGERVQAGVVLATLDPRDLDHALQSSGMALQVAQAGVSRTLQTARQSEIVAAQAALTAAQASLVRVVRGQGPELAAARSALEAAKANLARVGDAAGSELHVAQAAHAAALANLAKVRAGPTEADLAAVKAQLDNAGAALKQAQFGYDNAFRRDPAGIAAAPASLALERATNDFRLASANHDRVATGSDDVQLRAAEQQVAITQAALDRLGGVAAASNRAAAEQQVLASSAALARLGGVSEMSNRAAAEQQVAAAQAALEKLRAAPQPHDVQQAAAQLAQAELAHARALASRAQTVITAPFDAVVVEVRQHVGELATPGMTLFLLADPAHLEARVNVVEEDLPLVQSGQPVTALFDALPDLKIGGRVTRIIPQRIAGDRPLFPVQIAFARLPAPLLPGMTLEVDIITARAENVLMLPRSAVRMGAGDAASVDVWIASTRMRREIKTGLRGDTHVEVTAGLSAGEQVVLR